MQIFSKYINFFKLLRRVFLKSIQRPCNVLVSFLVGILMYSFIVFPAHLTLINELLHQGFFLSVFHVATYVFFNPWERVGVLQAWLLITSMIVLMVYVLMLMEFFRKQTQRAVSIFEWSGSMWSAILAFVGYGCTMCGTAFSGYIFTMLGFGFVSALLPFGGSEFTIIAILVGCFGIRSLVKKMS